MFTIRADSDGIAFFKCFGPRRIFPGRRPFRRNGHGCGGTQTHTAYIGRCTTHVTRVPWSVARAIALPRRLCGFIDGIAYEQDTSPYFPVWRSGSVQSDAFLSTAPCTPPATAPPCAHPDGHRGGGGCPWRCNESCGQHAGRGGLAHVPATAQATAFVATWIRGRRKGCYRRRRS